MSVGDTPKPNLRPLPPEPIDERGSYDEELGSSPRVDKPPPPRLESLTFPTNRLPQLDIPIIKRLPEVGDNNLDQPSCRSSHNIDPTLPLAVVPEKIMYNLWEQTQTQTEVKWAPPENAKNFRSMAYEIQLRCSGERTEWQRLTDNNWQPLYRVYYIEGKALFGRTRIEQDSSTTVVFLRVRPIGTLEVEGRMERKVGPWSENIVFSLEKRT